MKLTLSNIIVFILLAMLITAGIFLAIEHTRKNKYRAEAARLNKIIETAAERARNTVDDINKQAEEVEEREKVHIINMPADAVVIEFLPVDVVLQRNDDIGGITRGIVEATFRVIRRSGYRIVSIRGGGLEPGSEGRDSGIQAEVREGEGQGRSPEP